MVEGFVPPPTCHPWLAQLIEQRHLHSLWSVGVGET